MKRFKKQMVILLAVVLTLTFALTGCGDDPANTKDLPKIGIVQIVEHTSLDMIRNSIIAQLAKDGFTDGETVTIDYQSAQNDPNNLKTICQQFTSKGYDLIIAIATPSAQVALGETKEIPIIFSAVSNPIGDGLISQMKQPGGNISGTSDAVSASKIMDLAQQVTPGFKKIGALYSTSETNSEFVISELREYAKKNGMELVEAAAMNTSEIQQAATSLVGKVDIVFSPIDNTVASSLPVVTKVFNEAKLPYYVSADSMVMDGGLATCGIDYKVLGTETGKMATKVLNGTDVGTIDAMTMSDLSIYVNTDTAKKIGITFPQAILDQATVFTDENAGNK